MLACGPCLSEHTRQSRVLGIAYIVSPLHLHTGPYNDITLRPACFVNIFEDVQQLKVILFQTKSSLKQKNMGMFLA